MYKITFFIGLFSIIAPFIFRYNTNLAAYYTSIIAGLAVMYLSYKEGEAHGRQQWEYWMIEFVGISAIIASMVLDFGTFMIAEVMNFAIGMILLILSAVKINKYV